MVLLLLLLPVPLLLPPLLRLLLLLLAGVQLWQGLPVCSNIVEVYATYEDSNYIYLVCELAEGGDLFHYLASQPTFSEKDAATVGRQLLQAVAHCHLKGVVHRDLKPENVLLAGADDFTIKLVDFGSAAFIALKPDPSKGETETVLTDFMATPFYAAPEVWVHRYGREVDLWSVGAILYVLLTGLPPVLNSQAVHGNAKWQALQAGKVEGLPDGTSPALADLLAKLLEPSPGRRLSAVEALKHPWISGSVPLGTDNLEGSIRNIRAYTRVRKFQTAAVVLLSVIADARELRAIARKIRAAAAVTPEGPAAPGAGAGSSLRGAQNFFAAAAAAAGAAAGASSRSPSAADAGAAAGAKPADDYSLTAGELEGILRDMGLSAQAQQLKELRLQMLGAEDEGQTSFAARAFLDILACRQLALKHLSHTTKLDDARESDNSPSVSGKAESVPSWLRVGAQAGAELSSLSGAEREKIGGGINRLRLNQMGPSHRTQSAQNLSMLLEDGGASPSSSPHATASTLDPDASVSVARRRKDPRAVIGSSVHGDMLYQHLMSAESDR
eukprot:jgi/Mesen1/9847/ME000070S09127